VCFSAMCFSDVCFSAMCFSAMCVSDLRFSAMCYVVSVALSELSALPKSEGFGGVYSG
jgi:hypothetical protein